MKNVRIRTLLALITACVLVLALAVFLSFAPQMKNKSEWSVLQELEYSHRLSTEDNAVVFASSSGYEAIGIRSAWIPTVYPSPRYPRVWLLASPRYGQEVKKIPAEANYMISPSDLNLILHRLPNISSVTKNELQQHTMNEPK